MTILREIPLLSVNNSGASVIRELDLYIARLEAYERGETDAVPYVPAQTLIRAKEEIEAGLPIATEYPLDFGLHNIAFPEKND